MRGQKCRREKEQQVKEKDMKGHPNNFAAYLIFLLAGLSLLFTLKMETMCSFETSRCLLTTWRYNPEGRTLHSHLSENHISSL
jgi:hypothetical protein